MNIKTLFILAISIVAISGTALLFQSQVSYRRPVGDSSGLIIGTSAIYVAEQAVGRSVLVSVVRLEKPGFVVIHENAVGVPGKILGVSALFPAGEAENLPPIMLSRTMRDGEMVYAMLHADNGDGAFDVASDKPVRDLASGEPIMMVVTVSKDVVEPGVIDL